jgi:hypothetical protein
MVTGATGGLGRVIAIELARLGATVVIVCRDAAAGERLRQRIAAETGADRAEVIVGDLSARAGLRHVAGEFAAPTMSGYLLASRLHGTGVTVNAVHQGITATSIVDDIVPPLMRPFLGLIKRFLLTPEQGAAPVLRLATAPELTGVTGRYYVRDAEHRSPEISYDRDLQQRALGRQPAVHRHVRIPATRALRCSPAGSRQAGLARRVTANRGLGQAVEADSEMTPVGGEHGLVAVDPRGDMPHLCAQALKQECEGRLELITEAAAPPAAMSSAVTSERSSPNRSIQRRSAAGGKLGARCRRQKRTRGSPLRGVGCGCEPRPRGTRVPGPAKTDHAPIVLQCLLQTEHSPLSLPSLAAKGDR